MKSIKIDSHMVLMIIFLVSHFISDGISKYLAIYGGGGFHRISLIVRLISEVIMILYLLKNVNNNIIKYFIVIILLFLAFSIGQLSQGSENYLENLIFFNKYIFVFIVYLFSLKILFVKKSEFNLLYKILAGIFIVNIFFIFAGVIFEVELFKTFYSIDYRFGYDGIYLAGNEFSYFQIIMISYFYFKSYYQKGSVYLLLLSLIAGSFSGLKAVYAFMALLLVFHLIASVKKIYLLLLIPLFYYLSDYIISYVISDEFQQLVAFFLRIYEEKGLVYVLLSGRNEILATEFAQVLREWSFYNYFFGGVDVSKFLMEMEFFDLLLFFGGFGSLMYMYLYYVSFIKKLLWHKFFTFFLFTILSLSFFGGHFLTSASVSIYYVLVILYFQRYINDLQKSEVP